MKPPRPLLDVAMPDPGGAQPSLTVLIIEDQADIATSLSMFLELTAGHRVVIAFDGEAGIAAAIAHHPDVVVCDIGLPKKNGFEVAQELGRMPCRPLLIACTAFGDDAMRARGNAVGFDHYLVKPADPSRIAELLEAQKQKLMGTSWKTGF